MPQEAWPDIAGATKFPCGVWRSRDYLVQAYREAAGVLRLSVNRTMMKADGRWSDQLTWDELQKIKSELGYGDRYAIEVYPRDADIVNDANMRHLWVLPAPLSIGWFHQETKCAEVGDAT